MGTILPKIVLILQDRRPLSEVMSRGQNLEGVCSRISFSEPTPQTPIHPKPLSRSPTSPGSPAPTFPIHEHVPTPHTNTLHNSHPHASPCQTPALSDNAPPTPNPTPPSALTPVNENLHAHAQYGRNIFRPYHPTNAAPETTSRTFPPSQYPNTTAFTCERKRCISAPRRYLA